MNHPTREEWMSYLYDELTADEHSNLAAHLAVCPECKTQVDHWRVARTNLDAWRLPARSPAATTARPLFQWAAAAAVMIGVGFAIGRFAPATVNAEKLRAEIEPEIRRELRQEFGRVLREELDRSASATLATSGEQTRQVLSDFAKALQARRTEDNQAIYAALNKLESQRVADYVALKKDLDTVAVWTDVGLRRAQQQLVQLADYTQPAHNSTSPQN